MVQVHPARTGAAALLLFTSVLTACGKDATAPGTLVFATVSNGGAHSCALTATGATYCWGLNSHGQLGNGATANSPTPVPVAGGLVFTAVSSG